MSGGRGRALAAAGGVLGGLLVVGGGAGAWLTFEGVREVGGARLVEATTVPGSELAPTVIAWGLGLVVVGLVLLALRGRAARVVAAVLGLLAVAAGVAVGLGLGLAGGIDGGVDGGNGTLGSGGPTAGAGALLALVGAAVGARRPPAGRERALPARYDLEADPADEATAAWEEVSVEDGRGRTGR